LAFFYPFHVQIAVLDLFQKIFLQDGMVVRKKVASSSLQSCLDGKLEYRLSDSRISIKEQENIDENIPEEQGFDLRKVEVLCTHLHPLFANVSFSWNSGSLPEFLLRRFAEECDLDPGLDLQLIERFHDVPVWPDEFCLRDRGIIGKRGDEDDGNIHLVGNGFSRVNPVQPPRHDNVHQYQIRVQFSCLLDRILTRCCDTCNGVPHCIQTLFQLHCNNCFIIYHKYV